MRQQPNKSTAGEPFKGHHNMQRRITVLVAMIVLMLAGSKPAAAQNQKQAASALSPAVRLKPKLDHGRLDVYQAIATWLNNSSSNSGSCSLFCW